MAIQLQDYADNVTPTGFLYTWARNTGNMGNLANYYVETDMDGSTGRPIYRVRDIADQGANPNTDPSQPLVVDISAAGDATVAAEDKAAS